MWNLGALSDHGVLDLDERACLRFGLEHRAGAKVTERADQSTLTDGRRRRTTACGPISEPAPILTGAPDDRERVDHRIGLDLDLGVDPRASADRRW